MEWATQHCLNPYYCHQTISYNTSLMQKLGRGIEPQNHVQNPGGFPVGKNAEKAVCRNVFLTIWHCAELTENPLLQTVFFGEFAYWVRGQTIIKISVDICRTGLDGIKSENSIRKKLEVKNVPTFSAGFEEP